MPRTYAAKTTLKPHRKKVASQAFWTQPPRPTSSVVQHQKPATSIPRVTSVFQPDTHITGLPDNLKSGIESFSGMSMDHVRTHYNSSRPAQLNASAYAQGSDIHIAPGQEHHLPHKAWYIAQQAQGRVKPTMKIKDVAVNHDEGLEQEADVMGAKALQMQRPVRVATARATTQSTTALRRSALPIGPLGSILHRSSQEGVVQR